MKFVGPLGSSTTIFFPSSFLFSSKFQFCSECYQINRQSRKAKLIIIRMDIQCGPATLDIFKMMCVYLIQLPQKSI